MPIPASAPADREGVFDEIAERPVPVKDAELPVVVTGLSVSKPAAELEVVVPEEDELFMLDDVVSEELELVVEDEEEPETRLHLTVEDWLKFGGHIVKGGQHASDTPSASIAIRC